MNKFNIAHIKLCTEIEGPFKRCCIWFQGCNVLCKGCCNEELQPLKPCHIMSLEKLLEIIKESKDKYDIEGVTLSGGEPSLQKNLSLLNAEIHKLGLGIIMFTGHYINELNPELVNSTDLIIDGPFIESEIDHERLLIGSKNKNLHFITNRYKEQESYFYSNVAKEEVSIDDCIFINGD